MTNIVQIPVLETDRLRLRQFHIKDAHRVKQLAGTEELAMSTFLPHPYRNGVAERWIMSQFDDFRNGRLINFAIDLAEDELLIGSIGLELELNHHRAQLGYWIGLPFWNKGYCTEAAHGVLTYGFTKLGLNRIYAPHFRSNPASGRVLQKIGMKHEGSQRQHYLRFGKYEDAELFGILKEEYLQMQG